MSDDIEKIVINGKLVKLPNTEKLEDLLLSLKQSKVDKIPGKKLSDENYTKQDKDSVATIPHINSTLDNKVDKIDGKQLSDENFTSVEKRKLLELSNYDDTPIKSSLENINKSLTNINSILHYLKTDVDNKVNFVKGKQLSDINYTNSDKKKLDNLNNYDDTSLKNSISELRKNKVSVISGKQLSTNDFTNEYKNKLDNLINYDDSDVRNKLINLSETKVSKITGKQLSTNDFTNKDKSKLDNLFNYDDSSILISLEKLQGEIQHLIDLLNNKVEKEDNKGLSTEDFTKEFKEKLDNLNNYDDTAVLQELKSIKGLINKKIDSIEGKGLSDENYTREEKIKLSKLDVIEPMSMEEFNKIPEEKRTAPFYYIWED